MDGSPQEGVSKQAKHNRKKKKHKVRASTKYAFKLFKLASRGDSRRLDRLLQSHRHVDVNAFDAEGLTALHQVGDVTRTFMEGSQEGLQHRSPLK